MEPLVYKVNELNVYVGYKTFYHYIKQIHIHNRHVGFMYQIISTHTHNVLGPHCRQEIGQSMVVQRG